MNKVIQNITKSISNLPSTVSKTLNVGKIDTNFKDLLHNRIVLYAFVIIALFDLFYFAQIRDNMSIAIFILLAFITTFFSKNMIVVLCIALVVTHVLKFGVKQVSEGFEEGADGEEDELERKEGLEDEEEKPTEGLANENKDKKEKKEKKEEKIAEEEKKKDFEEFQQVQDKILGGMKDLDPLITKAEGFIEKYSHLMQQ
jgi:hypothetical protein